LSYSGNLLVENRNGLIVNGEVFVANGTAERSCTRGTTRCNGSPRWRGAAESAGAALLSKWLAEKLDFFSIGTNDLTQYVMATERGNASVAGLQDSLHPALLHLIRAVIHGANAHKRHVSVCGDAASDPLSAMTFVGLGVRSLSVRPKQVAEIRLLFRFLKIPDLEQLAGNSLRCSNATQVRMLAKERLDAISATNIVSVQDHELR
jgi:signal transduction protein with GAF and PtsI domain